MAMIDQPEKATRLARAIASDISLYNEDKIRMGIEQDNFFDALAAELEEGRQLYMSRVVGELDPQSHLYWQAIVNVIFRAKGHIKSNIW